MGLKVGFIGLGNIGRPMADNLMAPAFDLAVFDAVPAAAAHFEGRALIAGSPAEVARHAVLIGICVRDENDVSNVLHGPEGLLEKCSAGPQSPCRRRTGKPRAGGGSRAEIRLHGGR